MKLSYENLNTHANRLLFSLFIILFLGIGCSKESPLDQNDQLETKGNVEEAVRYEFYLDSKEVKEGDFDVENEKLQIHITGEPDPLTIGGGLIKIWAFNSEEAYVSWGEIYNEPIECTNEVERHIQEYAERSGAISYYERHGKLMPGFEDYANKYMDNANCFGDGGANERGLGLLYKDFSGGDWWILRRFDSFYPGSWRNKGSRYKSLSLLNQFRLYDKSFFRKRKATLSNWGWQTYRFQGPLLFLNDKQNSTMKFG